MFIGVTLFLCLWCNKLASVCFNSKTPHSKNFEVSCSNQSEKILIKPSNQKRKLSSQTIGTKLQLSQNPPPPPFLSDFSELAPPLLSLLCWRQTNYKVFYKKFGSGHSTKTFLISQKNFVHFSTKSFLIGFLFFEYRIIKVVANTAADMFLDIQNIVKEISVFCYLKTQLVR